MTRYLTTAGVACREQRTELSVLLAEFDRLDSITTGMGAPVTKQLIELLESSWRLLAESRSVLTSTANGRLAVILPHVDRHQAVELGNRFIRDLSGRARSMCVHSVDAPTISVGIASIAVIARNFRPSDMVEAAERCLYGAQTCGGSAIKSIEIY